MVELVRRGGCSDPKLPEILKRDRSKLAQRELAQRCFAGGLSNFEIDARTLRYEKRNVGNLQTVTFIKRSRISVAGDSHWRKC